MQPTNYEAERLEAAREQGAREQAAREQAAREQAAREQAAREQAARQQAVPVAERRPDTPEEGAEKEPEVIIVGHSFLFYWWPVWAIGFLMAAITYAGGQVREIGNERFWFYPSSNPGVLFLLTLLLVILITNITVRGMASVLVIVSAILVTVLLAYFQLWDPILSWLGDLRVQLNVGAYFWFSLFLFVVWAVSVFLIDPMTYWRVTPGQITREYVLGAASKTYDTENLTLEKHRDDVFRHWILGFGSGDLVLRPYGAEREEIPVRNVLFIGSKIIAIHRLIAAQPRGPHHHDPAVNAAAR